MRTWIVAVTSLVLAAPIAAQDHHHPAQPSATGDGSLPAGWHARLDRANASLSNVKLVRTAEGLHLALGPSGIFYNPEDVAEGRYMARATFTQEKPTQHPEAYGLFVGGQNLDGPDQDYLYFLIRQDGMFLIKHRAGTETHTITDWTAHSAVVPLREDGAATNTLVIEAAPQSARFLVNGTEVASFANVPQLNTDGIVGLRVNHNLEVQVSDFRIDRAEG